MTRDAKRYIAEEIRSACIKRQWYTRGDNAAYEAMFQMVDEGAAIMDISYNIYDHSEIEKCPCVGAAYEEIKKIVDEARRIFAD